jgi:hypothetical protein
LYGITQANREYYEEVLDFIVDDLNIQASKAPPGLFFGGDLGEANGVLISVYIDDIMIIGTSVHVASIASRSYDGFEVATHVPVPATFQYLGMTVARDRTKRSIAIDRIGSINRVLVCSEMTNCWKRPTLMEISYKQHVIQPDHGEQSFDARQYMKAIGLILYAGLGTRSYITYATSVLGRYVTQPSTIHWGAVKHLFRYLRGTSD